MGNSLRPTELVFRNERNKRNAEKWVDEIIRYVPDDAVVFVESGDSIEHGEHLKMVITIPIGSYFDTFDDEDGRNES